MTHRKGGEAMFVPLTRRDLVECVERTIGRFCQESESGVLSAISQRDAAVVDVSLVGDQSVCIKSHSSAGTLLLECTLSNLFLTMSDDVGDVIFWGAQREGTCTRVSIHRDGSLTIIVSCSTPTELYRNRG
jgi:hypothetical protein